MTGNQTAFDAGADFSRSKKKRPAIPIAYIPTAIGGLIIRTD
jgi:hypothetical protein